MSHNAQPAPAPTRRPLRTDYGVLLDDLGSTDMLDDLAAAQAHVAKHGGDIVRVETWPLHGQLVIPDRGAWIDHVRAATQRVDERDEQVVDVLLTAINGDPATTPVLTVDVMMTNYDQAQANYLEALDGWAHADQRAADAT
ncbi:MAG: hypothetical protein AAGC63_06235, partial [Propionicimonas sp.]